MAKVSGKNKLPDKKSINFAHIGEQKINAALAVLGILIIVILAGLFAKFAVSDRLASLQEKKNEKAALEAEEKRLEAEIASYGDLEAEYAHYTYEKFTDEELGWVSRREVLTIIRDTVLSTADLNSWTLSGNVLTLNVTGVNLETVSELSKTLENMDDVSYCMVSNAQTVSDSSEDTEGLSVTAVMTVYLKRSGEGTTK